MKTRSRLAKSLTVRALLFEPLCLPTALTYTNARWSVAMCLSSVVTPNVHNRTRKVVVVAVCVWRWGSDDSGGGRYTPHALDRACSASSQSRLLITARNR